MGLAFRITVGARYKQVVVPSLFLTFWHRFLTSCPLNQSFNHASSPHFQNQPQSKLPFKRHLYALPAPSWPITWIPSISTLLIR
jgi:hypothetical protein